MAARALCLPALCFLLLSGFAPPAPLRAGPPDDRDGDAGGPPESEVSFELTPQKYSARRGEALEVSLGISCLGVVQNLGLLSFSLEFDTSRLGFLDAVLDPTVQLGLEAEFQSFHSAEEGWVQGVVEVKDSGGGPGIVCAETRGIVALRFEVRVDAPEGEAWLTFTQPESASYEGQLSDGENRVYNSVRIRESDGPGHAGPRFANTREPRILEGMQRISILGDIGLFVRGDANGDDRVDISDPVYLLHHLYGGGPAPATGPAADANQDGLLD
ncbi:MAG: dockerin type I repeat-containing protein, partial [Thermoanaerobaculia bacterium]